MDTIVLTEAQHKALGYVLKATADNDNNHPILTAVNCNGHIEASDGFRLHCANTHAGGQAGPEYNGLAVFMSGSSVIKGAQKYYQHTYDGNAPLGTKFPEVSQIMPSTPVKARVHVSATLLRDALAGLDGMVTVTIYEESKEYVLTPPTPPIAIQGHTGDKYEDIDTFALVMPMNPQVNDESRWVPYK